jgi:hypothetical protein
MRLILFIFWLTLVSILAQRNAEEEAICAPFLTSPSTSPLVRHLVRNITVDENAEFSCSLVLQDAQLPLQIRATVHEGLYHLAMRHIEQGYIMSSAKFEKTTLIPREVSAYYHAKQLARIFSSSCQFQYNAGMWSMHALIGKSDEAVAFFENCFPASSFSEDSATEEGEEIEKVDKEDKNKAFHDTKFFSISQNKYDLLHHLVKAHLNLYNYEKALYWTRKLQDEFPFDLEIEFISKLVASHVNELSQGSQFSSRLGHTLELLVKDEIEREHYNSSSFYNRFKLPFSNRKGVAEQMESVVDTEGNIQNDLSSLPSSSWHPIVYTDVISDDLFLSHLQSRQPFIIRLNDSSLFDSYLGWDTQKWFSNGKRYLKEKLAESKVLLESIPYKKGISSSLNMYGQGVTNQREYQSFTDILNDNFYRSDKLYYLNIQPSESGENVYAPPLHILQSDLPFPSSSTQDHPLSIIEKNLTSINLWMGKVPKDLSFTQSRLHVDPTDNLYLLYEGKKRFHLWSPLAGKHLSPISPVYGVNEDGLPYHWNINSFTSFLKIHLKSHNLTLFQLFEQRNHSPVNIQSNENFEILDNVLNHDVDYDVDNIHFSSLQSKVNDELFLLQNDDNSNEKTLLPPEVIIDLEPGDILYLPSGFYHEVFSHSGFHSAINVWWKPPHWKNAIAVEKEISGLLYQKVLQSMLK